MSLIIDQQIIRDPINSNLPFFAGLEIGAYSNENIFGFNSDIDTGAGEDIWSVGGLFPFLSVAETINIVSSNAADDGAPLGTGAHSVVIEGLDASFNEILELVTMNGTTPVTTIQSFLRVRRIFVFQAGSTGSNVGSITADASVSVTTQAMIPSTPEPLGTSFSAIYTIPAGKSALFADTHASIEGGGSATAVISLLIRDANSANPAWRAGFQFTLRDTASQRQHILPLPAAIPEKYDMRLHATVGQNNTGIDAGFSVLLAPSP